MSEFHSCFAKKLNEYVGFCILRRPTAAGAVTNGS